MCTLIRKATKLNQNISMTFLSFVQLTVGEFFPFIFHSIHSLYLVWMCSLYLYTWWWCIVIGYSHSVSITVAFYMSWFFPSPFNIPLSSPVFQQLFHSTLYSTRQMNVINTNTAINNNKTTTTPPAKQKEIRKIHRIFHRFKSSFKWMPK